MVRQSAASSIQSGSSRRRTGAGPRKAASRRGDRPALDYLMNANSASHPGMPRVDDLDLVASFRTPCPGEDLYNTIRRHSTNRYLSPVEFEKEGWISLTACPRNQQQANGNRPNTSCSTSPVRQRGRIVGDPTTAAKDEAPSSVGRSPMPPRLPGLVQVEKASGPGRESQRWRGIAWQGSRRQPLWRPRSVEAEFRAGLGESGGGPVMIEPYVP